MADNELTNSTLKGLVHIYGAMSILFYLFIPVFGVDIPIFCFLGGHVNYYAFLGALVVSQLENHVITTVAIDTMLFIEILYPMLLLAFYLLAIIKSRFFPFGLLAVLSNLFTLFVIILSMLCAEGFALPEIFIFCNLIGNTGYCIAFFVQYHDLRMERRET